MTKKNVLITGGSKGLGFQLVEKFSKISNVSVLSRKKGKLKKNTSFFSVDLSNHSKTLKTLIKIKKKLKKIDLIICCTGGGKKISNDEINKKILLKYLDLNFFSVSNFIDTYLKVFRKEKTNIIVISSIASKKIIDAPIGYSVSKASLDYLVKILAKKYASKKIKLNLISPGNILIKGNSWDKKMKKNPKKIKNYIKKNVPLKTFISVDEIYNTIRLLSDSNSKNITGSDFILDGGQSI
tara:strand:- start:302 stop:1018 length:717 start_codon:yes stop_codon:yes gene_type:complete